MIPAPGKHWFWYGRRPFEVWFSRTENTHELSGRRVESFTFRTLGRKRAFLQHFVNDLVKCHTRRHGVQSRLYTYDDGWDYVEGYSPRVLESVVLEAGEKEHLLQDIAQFRRSKQRYERLGVPYHRGYLFYGPPGTGKTSLVSALATHFGLSIYVINLTDFTDRRLMSAVNQVPANSEGSTTSCTWERRVIARRWNYIAGFSQNCRKPRRASSLKLRGIRKRWRSFKGCSWL